MAFYCDKPIPKAAIIRLEFSSASKHHPIRLFAQVVYCERDEAHKMKRQQVRIQFEDLSGEDRMLLRHHVLQIADPKLAATTGFGKAYFPGMPAPACTYREMIPDEHLKLLQSKAYFSARELIYLKKFQAHLRPILGDPIPQNFKLLGSRVLKARHVALVELELKEGALHILGEVMWSQAEDKNRAESGLALVGYNKEEAVRIEKES
jgi:hypothetical protein